LGGKLAIYRIRQFLHAANALIRPETASEAAASRMLPPAAVSLFRSMPRYDRQHALSVANTLKEQGHTDEDLLVAALLHDVGKTALAGGALRLWHRVAVVLLRVLGPGLLQRIGREQPGSWRYPFFVQQHHSAISAELAREAGCSEVSVALIRHHEDPSAEGGDHLLEALQAADGMN
jgi:hypothetical protein